MPERYPDDLTLLALAEDPLTGVDYIPTGRSPYYLEFRRLVQRTLLAAGRANDLRVYQDGDLTVGVRPGRCRIANAPLTFDGATTIAVDADATTHVWLDASGDVQTATDGLPTDRTTFVPLAQIVADSERITAITDLRGEAFLAVPNLATFGVEVDAERINAALDGTSPSVAAAALNILTAGPTSNADAYHRHLQADQTVNGEAYFTLFNKSAHAAANIALLFALPNRLPDDTVLVPSLTHGFLTQRYNGDTFNLVGSVHAQFRHEGTLTATLTDKLLGAVPVDGTVTDVILSLGSNIVSSTSSDGVTATAKVNGVTLTTTHPKITHAAGSGFRSTARGHGTAAAVKTDGTQNVQRGDVLTLDLTRTAAGTVSNEAAHAVVLVVIRAARPE